MGVVAPCMSRDLAPNMRGGGVSARVTVIAAAAAAVAAVAAVGVVEEVEL